MYISNYFQNATRLEIVLVKKENGNFWSSVVPNEKHGVHEIEGEEQQRIDEVHEQLKHLTSDGNTKVVNNLRFNFLYICEYARIICQYTPKLKLFRKFMNVESRNHNKRDYPYF